MIRRVTKMIGRSVINGETATLIPALLLCLSVSVITSVSKGPGDIPAASPRNAPVNANFMIINANYFTARLFLLF